MDFTHPADEQFSTKVCWKSKKEMKTLVTNIVGDTGRGMRIGDSTMSEISKRVGIYQLVIFMRVYANCIRFTGNIQLGLKDLFGDDWDTVRAYTPDTPEDADLFGIGLSFPVMVSHGGGVKPYFTIQVEDDAELATVVQRIFKVQL